MQRTERGTDCGHRRRFRGILAAPRRGIPVQRVNCRPDRLRRRRRFRGILACRRISLTCALGRRVVEHGPDQLGFFRVQHGLDLDHPVFGITPADVATLLVVQRVRVPAVAMHQRVLA